VAVAMPTPEDLPDGPLRRLVQAIHELYATAGRPGVRQISNAIKDRDDLRDTVSHETVSAMLRGEGLPRWVKLECVIRQLAAWAVTQPDADDSVRRFHRLWLEADDAPASKAVMSSPPGRPDHALHGGVFAFPRARLPTIPTTIFNAPARNDHFIGRRQVLDEMRRALEQQPRRPLVIRGIGGVGKTQLTVEFAYRYASEYDLIWWVPAEEPVQARAALAALAERLSLARSTDLNQTARAALDALESSELRWLVVFDNAERSSEIRSVLPAGGDVIVTTRSLGWSRFGSVVEVDVFDRPESIELLRRRGRNIGVDDADRLAARLGDLPLALEQVAAVQSATGMSVSDYLRLFAEHVGDLLSTQPPPEYPTSVATFVNLAIDSLRVRAPAAVQLLELFAFLGPEPVPVSLFRPRRDADIEPPLGRAVHQFDFIERVVGQLISYGVARLEPQGERIQVHRLVRAVLRERLDPDSSDRIRETTHHLLGAANPGNPGDPRTWTLHAEIGPHLIPSDAIHANVLSARRAVIDQVRYLERRGEYDESRRLGEMALQAWGAPVEEGGLGPEHELTLRAVRDLANVMRAQGSYRDARRITEDALERLRHSPAYGEDHPRTLDLAGAVGTYLRLTGDYERALDVDRDVVERRRRIGGDTDPATLRAVLNLAVSLRFNGEFAEAFSVDQQARDAYAQSNGAEHPDTLLASSNLARDLYGLGRYDECRELIRGLLPRQTELHGSTHEHVLQSNRMQAIAWRKTGYRADAVGLASSSFRASYSAAGPDHENTLLAMMSYANALRSAGDVVGAKTLAAEALARYRAAFGLRNPVTLAAAINFAIVLRAAGDRDEAFRIDQVTLLELRQSVGEGHPYTLAATAGLANDLALAHETTSAISLSEDLVARACATFGPGHPNTIGFQYNLGLDLSSAGDDAAGQDLQARAKAELATVDGDLPDGPSSTGRIECDIEPPES
jgi:tetratricopeptide (TPR) repeat protein